MFGCAADSGAKLAIIAAAPFSVGAHPRQVLAIGARNWDCETTIADVTRAAISKVVNASTLDELAAGIEARLTKECRRQLRQVGVYVHRTALTDFSTCRVYKVLGDKGPTPQIGV